MYNEIKLPGSQPEAVEVAEVAPEKELREYSLPKYMAGVNPEEILGEDITNLVSEIMAQFTDHEIATPELDKIMPAKGKARTRTSAPKKKAGATTPAPSPATSPVSSTPTSIFSPEPIDTTKVESLGIEDEEVAEGIPMSERKYLRPNGDYYYARKWGDHVDVDVLKKAREAQQYVMLYGNPGTGKTALVEATFPDELYTVLGSGDTEVSDLVGSYVQTPSGNYEWVDGALVKSAEEGKVLLIDEVGLIDPKVLSVVYSLIDGRQELTVTANPERGTVKAKEGFYVIGATNPNAVGVRLSEALLSRFTIQAEMTTDWELAKTELGVNEKMVASAKNMAKKQEAGEVGWSPQMRELIAFRDNEKLFGTKWAVENLLASAPEIDRPVFSQSLYNLFGGTVFNPARI